MKSLKKSVKAKILLIVSIALIISLILSLTLTQTNAAATDEYSQRFLDLYDDIKDPANGYYSDKGIPYHSVETLIVEAPDYGHETTSEAFSYMMWLEAMYGKFSGDFSGFKESWDTTERYIIPTDADQPGMETYNPSSPASYAGEYETPNQYPSKLDFDIKVGQDPISNELKNAYGQSEIYGMHWLLDVDNWYGYGSRGDGSSAPSYINTFQRGEQESCWETVPHPSWEAFNWGGSNGFLDLFVDDKSYSKQWRYTNAPDADARAVQATYMAQQWAKEAGVDLSSEVDKATKMGDYLRYSMFDKYFMEIGAEGTTPATGYDSAHYLMSWYYSWGGGIGSAWSWKIGSSHNHFGYQNPFAAYVLAKEPDFKPKAANGAADWGKSLDRQLEFYAWLQSAEGGIAGGATNSYKGRYETYPSGTSTFYGMAYEENPVYHDPGSNTWFGFQAWSMQRIAQLYYETGNKTAKDILDNWVPWVKDSVELTADGGYAIPSSIGWSGQPTTFNGLPHSNKGLHVTVESTSQDVGITASLANTLLYYAAASKDDESRILAKELLDRQWTLYRDEIGVSSPEARGDFKRFFEQEVFIPEGFSGKMANGDEIKPGATFFDIRSKYKDDPAFPALEAAYAAGEDPEFNYHRYWAQCDIAIANGVYSILFGENTEPTEEPTTEVTTAPVTTAPVTTAPVTTAPITVAPVTTAPVTTAPITVAPVTTAPVTTEPMKDKISVAFTQNDWGSGATATIVIANNGTTPINGWTLSFSFSGNQKITNLWSGSFTQSGKNVTIKNADWNGTIEPSRSINFGFNINYSGTNTAPTSFTVN